MRLSPGVFYECIQVFFFPAHDTIELWNISRYILPRIFISYSQIISLAHSSYLFCAKYTKTKLHIKWISAFNWKLFTMKLCWTSVYREADVCDPLSMNMMLCKLFCKVKAIFVQLKWHWKPHTFKLRMDAPTLLLKNKVDMDVKI